MRRSADLRWLTYLIVVVALSSLALRPIVSGPEEESTERTILLSIRDPQTGAALILMFRPKFRRIDAHISDTSHILVTRRKVLTSPECTTLYTFLKQKFKHDNVSLPGDHFWCMYTSDNCATELMRQPTLAKVQQELLFKMFPPPPNPDQR